MHNNSAYAVGQGSPRPTERTPISRESARPWFRVVTRQQRVAIQTYGPNWWSEWQPRWLKCNISEGSGDAWVQHADLPLLIDAMSCLEVPRLRQGMILDPRRDRGDVELTYRTEGLLQFRRGTFEVAMRSISDPPPVFEDIFASLQAPQPYVATTTLLLRDVLGWIEHQLDAWPQKKAHAIARLQGGAASVISPSGGATLLGLDAFPNMLLSHPLVEACYAWTRRVTDRHVLFHEPVGHGRDRRFHLVSSSDGADRLLILTSNPDASDGPGEPAETSPWISAQKVDLQRAVHFAILSMYRSNGLIELTIDEARDGCPTFTASSREKWERRKSPEGVHAIPAPSASMSNPFQCAYPCQKGVDGPRSILMNPTVLRRAISALSSDQVHISIHGETGIVTVDEFTGATDHSVRAIAWLKGDSTGWTPAFHPTNCAKESQTA